MWSRIRQIGEQVVLADKRIRGSQGIGRLSAPAHGTYSLSLQHRLGINGRLRRDVEGPACPYVH